MGAAGAESLRSSRAVSRQIQPNPSIFNGEALPDFIDPLVERVEPRVKASVVKIKYIAAGQKSENPVVGFHVDEYLLDRVTDKNNNVPQHVHRIPRFEKMKFYHGRKAGCSGESRSLLQQINRASITFPGANCDAASGRAIVEQME
jgi:hypothetical protein